MTEHNADPDWIERVMRDDWLNDNPGRPPRLLITRDAKGGSAVVVGRRAGEVVERVLGPRHPHGGAYSVRACDVDPIVAVAHQLGGSVTLEDVG